MTSVTGCFWPKAAIKRFWKKEFLPSIQLSGRLLS